MKEVKVYPKFKCDFCKKRAVKASMEKHEIICWYNPNRKCRTCDGEGTQFFANAYPPDYGVFEDERPCPDCARAEEIKKKKELLALSSVGDK